MLYVSARMEEDLMIKTEEMEQHRKMEQALVSSTCLGLISRPQMCLCCWRRSRRPSCDAGCSPACGRDTGNCSSCPGRTHWCPSTQSPDYTANRRQIRWSLCNKALNHEKKTGNVSMTTPPSSTLKPIKSIKLKEFPLSHLEAVNLFAGFILLRLLNMTVLLCTDHHPSLGNTCGSHGNGKSSLILQQTPLLPQEFLLF